MNNRIIFTSILAIAAFAAAANAQHVRAFTDRGSVGLVPATDSAVPSLVAVAGETIKVRIAGNTTNYFTDDYSLTVAGIGTVQVPCDTQGPLARRSAPGKVPLSNKLISFNSSTPATTEPGWKGTCRLLSVKLRNGTEYRARVIFR